MTVFSSHDQVLESVWEVLSRRVLDRALAATELLEGIFTSLGPIHREDDRLFAGDVDLGRDHQRLQAIARASGLGISLYLGHRRIANASVLEAGAPPPLGGNAPPVLIEEVSRRRNVFSGEVTHGDRAYLSVARPLGHASERGLAPIGVLEAYQDKHFTAGVIEDVTRQALQLQRGAEREGAHSLASASTLVDSLARRLQLLALNGNILAAQAGSHGHAFRVVCREMSNLGTHARRAAQEVRRVDPSGVGNPAQQAPRPPLAPPSTPRVSGDDPPGG